jgi:hypothetical protein
MSTSAQLDQRHGIASVLPTGSETCRVCGAESSFAFEGLVIGHRVRYHDCAVCGHFQTETPHWLDEAYSSAINDVDTGILSRNLHNVPRVVMTLLSYGKLHGMVVDHAGGYGILVRLLRDAGVDARWQDKYCQNLVARGFEAEDGPCDLVTAFEVFEHFVEPLPELRAMLTRAPVVLLSTQLIRSAAPPAPDWWYLGAAHGQHIGFFRARTLAWMAEELGVHHATDGRDTHLFSIHPVPRHWKRLLRWPRLAMYLASRHLSSLRDTDHDALSKRACP